MSNAQIVYVSERGFPLICQKPGETPIVTVENYCKWYRLYLLMPNGEVKPVTPELVESVNAFENAWMIDHTFHPDLLRAVARKIGGYVDTVSLEAAAGRWVMENHGQFDYMDDLEDVCLPEHRLPSSLESEGLEVVLTPPSVDAAAVVANLQRTSRKIQRSGLYGKFGSKSTLIKAPEDLSQTDIQILVVIMMSGERDQVIAEGRKAKLWGGEDTPENQEAFWQSVLQARQLLGI